MSITVTPVAVTIETLEQAREAYVRIVGSEYGAGKIYAQFLINEFGIEWIEAAHNAPGAEMDKFRVEREELYKGLKSAGHSNPSVKLKQIKDHARRILKSLEAPVEGESAEGESAEGESAGKRDTKSVQRRLVEDLTVLFKYAKKQVLDENQAKAFRSIGQALRDLGVNTDNIA